MRGILFDMDGVLYNSEEAIEGAAETIRWVQSKNIPYLYVTNTTSRSRIHLVEKLKRFGIEASLDRIMTPCVAASEWLRMHSNGSVALFVSQKAFVEFDGLEILPSGVEEGARYVVIGDLGEGWDFRTLNRAFRLLHSNPEAVLIALGMTPYWQAHDGLRLDTAPFVAALEQATGRKPMIFGKPAAGFYQAAVKQLGLPAEDAVMIGDGIETDIAGAQRAGLKAVLVRTGKFRDTDLAGGIIPDAILDSIRALPAWWKNLCT
jgi:phospholysine phosphohistidine inorganic pyrophosphate phosphatase